MIRISLVVAALVSFSSCKDKDASKTQPEATTETAPTPAAVPTPVDDALSERCAKALSKVTLDEIMADLAKPSPEEQAIMDGIRKQSQASCEAEGLSEQQAACFDTIVDIETLFLAADCPAVAAKTPSWLRVPPPEARKMALEEMKKKKEQDDATGDKEE